MFQPTLLVLDQEGPQAKRLVSLVNCSHWSAPAEKYQVNRETTILCPVVVPDKCPYLAIERASRPCGNTNRVDVRERNIEIHPQLRQAA